MPTPRSSLHRQASRSVSTSQGNPESPTKTLLLSSQQEKGPSIKPDVVRVAIDLGSYSIRICVAKLGDETSKIVKYPNVIVKTSQKRVLGAGSGLLTGPQIKQDCRNYGSLSLRQPMDRGIIIDWPTQKVILDVSLSEALKLANVTSKHGDRLLEGMEVIITESYFNLPDLQSGMDILLLEGYGAAKIWRCSPALLVPHHPRLFSSDGALIPGKKRRRPECICIIDLGHSATHVVPVAKDSVTWTAVRRHIISQRLLTNLLKETLSFRQWDMMDESWLVGHVKQECCFVACSAGSRGDNIDLQQDKPSEWSYAGMLAMCADLAVQSNPLTVEYVLPDYAVASSRGTLGYIKGGPERSKVGSTQDFIVRSTDRMSNGAKKRLTESEESSSDESDDDFQENSPDVSSSIPKKRRKKQSMMGREKPKDQEEDMEQVLILERERFQIPEVMFDPGIIGLDDAPLPQVIEESIRSCDEEVHGLLWSNIVLVGGGAKMIGLRQRLLNELRPRAPAGLPLNVYIAEDPSLSAIIGAEALFMESTRILSDHFISAHDYSPHKVRDKFDTWSNVPSTALST